jgi:DNA-binding transcriptional LysR family regulator
MELRNVEYFLTIAKAGSMRAAAKTLGMTQPALTKAMRRMEDQAGVPFFERSAHGVSLTEYGQSFLRHARMLKASMTDAANDLEALRRGTAGRVRIGAGPSWQTRILPEAITAFRAERPAVLIEIHAGLDDSLKQDLRNGMLDFVLAVLPEGSEDPDLDGQALVLDDYRVIADRSHPLHRAAEFDFADLLAFPWVLPGRSTYLVRRLEIMMRARGLPPPRATVETDIVALKIALMRGSDYLSFHAVDHLATLGETGIVPLRQADASWPRRAGIVTRHGVEHDAATRRLIDIIIACSKPAP